MRRYAPAALAAALLGQRARRRWLHLIVGGALFMPFWMVGTLLMGPLLDEGGMFSGGLGVQFGAYAVGLPLVAVAALFPLARPMAVAAARGSRTRPSGRSSSRARA